MTLLFVICGVRVTDDRVQAHKTWIWSRERIPGIRSCANHIQHAAEAFVSTTTTSTTMSLRSTILHHALPLLPTHSFARQTLLTALSSTRNAPPSPHSQENVIDTLFGGTVAPARALVDAWAEEGLKVMKPSDGAGPSSLREVLGRRLEYSAGVGEHLVEVRVYLNSLPTSWFRAALLSQLEASICTQRMRLVDPYAYADD